MLPRAKILIWSSDPNIIRTFKPSMLPKNQKLYLLLEIKSEPSLNKANIVKQIVHEVREKKLGNRTVLHSFDWDLLKECHKVAPEIRVLFYLSYQKTQKTLSIILLKKLHQIFVLLKLLYRKP